MKALWMTANNCWAICFGDSLCPIDGKTFFATKAELVDWIKPKGLTLRGRKIELA